MTQKMLPQVEALRLILYSLRGETEDRLTALRHKHLNIQGLLDAGLLVPGPYATSVYCDSCCDSGDVFWSEHPKTGAKRVVYRCQCGINPIKPEDLQTWPVVASTLVRRLSEAMEFPAPPQESIPNRVWSFGRKMRREFYFVTTYASPRERSTLRGFFAPYTTAVLLAATSVVQEDLAELLPGHLVFNMEAITTLDDSCRLSVDMGPILAEVEPPAELKKKTPSRRGNRAANIEKLVNEVKQHLLSARDHVHATGELLPRPSLQDLGKLAGLEKYEVSRCMKDKDAQILRLLWGVANDIKQVRNWKG